MINKIRKSLTVLTLCCTVAATALKAQDTKNGEQPRLPRVLLIGDSIASGYTEPLRQHLAGKATVGAVPKDGFYTVLALTNLNNMLGDGKWDIINFNWGLNDLEGRRVKLPQYEANLRTLVKRLKETGASLVWCSTTPVPSGKVNSPRIYTDVPEYNAIAEKVMNENGVPINDLYNFALPRLADLQLKEDVHFTPAGYAALGEQVAEQILITLTLEKSRKKSNAAEAKQHGVPRVLLIGDSIAGGYSDPVRQQLEGRVAVTGVPSIGCVTFQAMTNLHNLLGDGNWDVIHFNWGLNDLEGRRIRPPKYEGNLRILLKRLQQTGAKLVWASTTPVPSGKVNSPRIYTDVPEYNLVAEKVMKENSIPINDLYNFALPRLADLQLKEDVHFTPAGYAVLGQQVTEQILLTLRLVDSPKKSNQDTKSSGQQRLPKVLLIGDSICGGYSEPVRQRLMGKVDVTTVPPNGWATFLALTNLHNMVGDHDWDLIHFNWGLNDLEGRRVLIPKYEANLQVLLKRLQQRSAKQLWCSTTPVPMGKVNSPRIYTDVPIYNAAAAKIMEENNIPIHDLYSFALPRLADLQLKEDVHFTPSGYSVLAEQVAEHILMALKAEEPAKVEKQKQ